MAAKGAARCSAWWMSSVAARRRLRMDGGRLAAAASKTSAMLIASASCHLRQRLLQMLGAIRFVDHRCARIVGQEGRAVAIAGGEDEGYSPRRQRRRDRGTGF